MLYYVIADKNLKTFFNTQYEKSTTCEPYFYTDKDVVEHVFGLFKHKLNSDFAIRCIRIVEQTGVSNIKELKC